MILAIIERILAGIGALASIVGLVQSLRLYYWKKQLTWDDSLRTANHLLAKIQGSGWDPEVVVGVGRSGAIWGGWLAGNLGSKPITVIDDKYTPEVELPGGAEILEALHKTCPRMQRMLVVEGASSTGHTFQHFQQLFGERLSGIEVRFAVLYKSPLSKAKIDYIGEEGPEPWPVKFPWHHSDLYRPYLRDLFPIPIRNTSQHPKSR